MKEVNSSDLDELIYSLEERGFPESASGHEKYRELSRNVRDVSPVYDRKMTEFVFEQDYESAYNLAEALDENKEYLEDQELDFNQLLKNDFSKLRMITWKAIPGIKLN